jgi:hypothetical protein
MDVNVLKSYYIILNHNFVAQFCYQHFIQGWTDSL